MGKSSKLRLLVIMGVSGSGKTTVAQHLAAKTGYTYLDADDFHSQEAKDRMANGQPLDDGMRLPWLHGIKQALEKHYAAGENCVIAISGLKVWLRKLLFDTVYDARGYLLHGDFDLIKARMIQRGDHFMSPELLQSQFEDLELPFDGENIVVLDCEESVETLCETIVKGLAS